MASGASRYGGPVYDATIHPAIANLEGSRADRLAADSGLLLFGDKSAAAAVYSHYREQLPNTTAVQIMGLAQQFHYTTEAVERKSSMPYPGVRLGPPPGIHRAPDTSPVVGPPTHLPFGRRSMSRDQGRRLFNR
jgi:hypothetical protein